MQADPKLIEKIRKILKRTEEAGCTQAEADAAFAMASRLLAEHNLDMSVVTAEMPEWTEETACETGRFSLEHTLASRIVENFFFVKGILYTPYKRSKRLVYFGTKDNVEVAKFTFNELIDNFDILWKNYRAKNHLPLSEKRAYITGVAKGFMDKMAEERKVLEAEQDIIQGRNDGGTSIILASVMQKTQIAFAEKHGELKKRVTTFAPTRGSQSSFDAGYKSGRSLNINRKLGGGTNRKSIEG